MKTSTSRTIVKNIVVAITLGIAAVATLAFTHSETPSLGVAATASRNG
jgi:hypothetical protein